MVSSVIENYVVKAVKRDTLGLVDYTEVKQSMLSFIRPFLFDDLGERLVADTRFLTADDLVPKWAIDCDGAFLFGAGWISLVRQVVFRMALERGCSVADHRLLEAVGRSEVAYTSYDTGIDQDVGGLYGPLTDFAID